CGLLELACRCGPGDRPGSPVRVRGRTDERVPPAVVTGDLDRPTCPAAPGPPAPPPSGPPPPAPGSARCPVVDRSRAGAGFAPVAPWGTTDSGRRFTDIRHVSSCGWTDQPGRGHRITATARGAATVGKGRCLCHCGGDRRTPAPAWR